MSIEDLRAKAKPRQAKARILVDGSLRAEHDALELQLAGAQQTDMQLANPDLRAIAEQLVDLEERIVDAETEFTFEPIGTTAWYKLLGAHPPRAEDKADHNPMTFPPAALVASCVEPELSAEDAMWLRDTLDLGEWLRLWNACLLVNLGESGRPKSLGASTILRLSGTSSTTAPLEESLGASS